MVVDDRRTTSAPAGCRSFREGVRWSCAYNAMNWPRDTIGCFTRRSLLTLQSSTASGRRRPGRVGGQGTPPRNFVFTPGIAARLFTAVAKAGINVDVIVQNISEEGETDISFTVGRDDLQLVRKVVQGLSEISFREDLYDASIAKVSLVGVGMRSHTGVASRMFQTLADLHINIQMISTSEIRVSVVIQETKADEACRALHTAFGLDKGA